MRVKVVLVSAATALSAGAAGACSFLPAPFDTPFDGFGTSDLIYVARISPADPSPDGLDRIQVDAIKAIKGTPPPQKLFDEEGSAACGTGYFEDPGAPTAYHAVLFQSSTQSNAGFFVQSHPGVYFESEAAALRGADRIVAAMAADPGLEISAKSGPAPFEVRLDGESELVRRIREHFDQGRECLTTEFGTWGVFQDWKGGFVLDWGDRSIRRGILYRPAGWAYVPRAGDETVCLDPFRHSYAVPGTYTVRGSLFDRDPDNGNIDWRWTGTATVTVLPTEQPETLRLDSEFQGEIPVGDYRRFDIDWSIASAQGGTVELRVTSADGRTLWKEDFDDAALAGDLSSSVQLTDDDLRPAEGDPVAAFLRLALVREGVTVVEIVAGPALLTPEIVEEDDYRRPYATYDAADLRQITFHKRVSDPDCLRYRIDWGDGTETFGAKDRPPGSCDASGIDELAVAHRYAAPGFYRIRYFSDEETRDGVVDPVLFRAVTVTVP